ncbi:hypothetical protein HPP92_018887 [Vanilla planifolia]|uniref:Non-haem dioxygenase N-terminal domain-containing protein n=1 Tax=Vanilla planifolia TaxID=51239 RepID=A0A835QGH2_VANPL|nr:hypothetical protein HPP92_018887 [Vanilla planifolia]
MPVETISLPLIDRANFPAELGKLTATATRLGCFRIVNHWIPVELMTEAKAAAYSLSKLPHDTKIRNGDVIFGSGYRSSMPSFPLLQTFGIYDASSTADVRAFCSSMEASPHQRCSCPHFLPFALSPNFTLGGVLIPRLGMHHEAKHLRLH